MDGVKFCKSNSFFGFLKCKLFHLTLAVSSCFLKYIDMGVAAFWHQIRLNRKYCALAWGSKQGPQQGSCQLLNDRAAVTLRSWEYIRHTGLAVQHYASVVCALYLWEVSQDLVYFYISYNSKAFFKSSEKQELFFIHSFTFSFDRVPPICMDPWGTESAFKTPPMFLLFV